MADTDIKWFSFDNTNAPQLSNKWGCLVDVLNACLINGFGSQQVTSLVIKDGVGTAMFAGNHSFKQFQVIEISGADNAILNGEFKILGLTANTTEFVVDAPNQTASGTISAKIAPLGWTKAFSGTQKAVYQAKDTQANPYYLRVDNSKDPVYTDSYAKFAKVGILQTCTNIDDISGNQAPFDSANPTKNWVGTGAGARAIAGWFKWQYAVHDTAASKDNYYESEGASDGNRSWVIIGNGSSFYLVNQATVSTILEIPYAFGAITHNDVAKPFLIAVNRYAEANMNVGARTSLGNPALIDVVTFYDYAGVIAKNKLSRLFGVFNNNPSGSTENIIKVDPTTGYILSTFCLADYENFIIGEMPLVRSCINDATTAANHSIFTDETGAYLACRYRIESAKGLGTLFFKIYEVE